MNSERRKVWYAPNRFESYGEEEIEAVKQCLQDGWLAGFGPRQIVPPKVEYSLTEFGNSLIPILRSLSDWNKRNSRTILFKLNKNFEEDRIR